MGMDATPATPPSLLCLANERGFRGDGCTGYRCSNAELDAHNCSWLGSTTCASCRGFKCPTLVLVGRATGRLVASPDRLLSSVTATLHATCYSTCDPRSLLLILPFARRATGPATRAPLQQRAIATRAPMRRRAPPPRMGRPRTGTGRSGPCCRRTPRRHTGFTQALEIAIRWVAVAARSDRERSKARGRTPICYAQHDAQPKAVRTSSITNQRLARCGERGTLVTGRTDFANRDRGWATLAGKAVYTSINDVCAGINHLHSCI
jgi:hypothetical protein